MSSSSTNTDKKSRDKDQLYKNKFDNFVKILGPNWPLDDIRALVESDVYHGDLTKFLENGCSKELAVSILL
jgi:regulatory protein YycI of two-component signal transduction system YycFG